MTIFGQAALTEEGVNLFYKIWLNLVYGVNENHQIIEGLEKPILGQSMTVPVEEFYKIRCAMWENPQFIDEYLDQNVTIIEEEREIISLWRKHFIKDKFVVVKHLAKYSVLSTFSGDPVTLYGVYGIKDSIEDTNPLPTPFLLDTVLLPFKDRIIYDSLAKIFSVGFGSGIRSSFNKSYQEAKATQGIVESLTLPRPAPELSPKKQTRRKKKLILLSL
ncbi:MAG: hypothetical protein LBT38_06730 [Deltaproteobacteria bacterium]|jgi:hypothetical protein|nr:hypothetical protein [Deltaproteobacteria bacterium]